jgi:hypothetical protein
MSTQNSGSLTLNQAAEQNAVVRPLTCEELEQANKEAREKETKSSFRGGALTTAYRRDGNNNGKYMKAMCPNLPKKRFEDGYQKSLPEDGKQPPCAGGRTPGAGRVNDAENKILNPEMAAGQGGMILMSTWHTGANGPDAMPCFSCRRAICEAEVCGIHVWLCKATNKPPDEVRPRDAGLCPPEPGKGDFDQKWADAGLGVLPS